MQTRDSPVQATPLPPPPAPPARDANPWPWPEEAGSAAPQEPRLLPRPLRRRRAGQAASQAPRLGLAIGIAVLVMTLALRKGLTGGPRDWAGVMFAVLLLGVFVLARLKKAGRRAARTGRRDDAG
jgi:hypothetical protein